MERIDVVILGVGVLVLVASIIGVVLYEPTAGDEFAVAYAAGPETAVGSAASQSGGPQTFTFEVPVNGTSMLDLHFDISASTGSPRATGDQVSVEVSGPGGNAGSGSFGMAAGPTGTGSTRVTIAIHDLPDAQTVAAADDADARTVALAAQSWTTGTGTWTVTVTVAGGTAAPGPATPNYTVNVDAVATSVHIASVTPA